MELNNTLKDQRLFLLFSTALMMVTKSSRVLQEGGADPMAVQHINEAVKLISQQLDAEALRLEIEMEAIKDIESLRKQLGIPHTNSDPSS